MQPHSDSFTHTHTLSLYSAMDALALLPTPPLRLVGAVLAPATVGTTHRCRSTSARRDEAADWAAARRRSASHREALALGRAAVALYTRGARVCSRLPWVCLALPGLQGDVAAWQVVALVVVVALAGAPLVEVLALTLVLAL